MKTNNAQSTRKRMTRPPAFQVATLHDPPQNTTSGEGAQRPIRQPARSLTNTMRRPLRARGFGGASIGTHIDVIFTTIFTSIYLDILTALVILFKKYIYLRGFDGNFDIDLTAILI